MALDKQSFRDMLKERRAALDPNLRNIMDGRIRSAVLQSQEWRQAKAVFAYLDFGDEVPTRGLIEKALAAGKLVLLPRVVPGPERQLAWYWVKDAAEPDGFERSAFGVPEPPDDPKRLVDVAAICAGAGEGGALALVPGLAFDAAGYRIGYGGGYYDVFLRGFAGVSLGLCRRAFYVTELPFRDEHDVPVTRVITG